MGVGGGERGFMDRSLRWMMRKVYSIFSADLRESAVIGPNNKCELPDRERMRAREREREREREDLRESAVIWPNNRCELPDSERARERERQRARSRATQKFIVNQQVTQGR